MCIIISWCCVTDTIYLKMNLVSREPKQMSHRIYICMVSTRKNYRACLVLPLLLYICLCFEPVTKQVKIISRSAFLFPFHQSVGTSAVKVAKMCPFCEEVLGEWMVWACVPWNQPQWDSMRSSSPWLGMFITCCHSLHRHTSFIKHSTPGSCQIVDEDEVIVKNLKSIVANWRKKSPQQTPDW